MLPLIGEDVHIAVTRCDKRRSLIESKPPFEELVEENRAQADREVHAHVGDDCVDVVVLGVVRDKRVKSIDLRKSLTGKVDNGFTDSVTIMTIWCLSAP